MTIRWGVPVIVLALVTYAAWSAWESRFAYVVVETTRGGEAAGQLEFFRHEDSGAAPSPPPKLGEVAFAGEGPHAAGPDLVPREGLVRIEAAGYGRGFTYVASGTTQVCTLGPVASTWGVVLGPEDAPVRGARVVALGGGRHGVPLADTVTGPGGRFDLEGFSSTIDTLHVRVLAPGFAVAETTWWLEGDQQREVRLHPTRPVTGVLRPPPGVPAGGQRVQAFQLPGVDALTAPDGTFRIDHLPGPPTVTRLVVPSLPATFTHRQILVQPGDDEVEIEVLPSGEVAGRVILAVSGQPLPGTSVRHEYGPDGLEVARCDAEGAFRIGRLPPGPVSLFATVARRDAGPDRPGRARPRWQTGSVTLTLEPGETRGGVVIELLP